MMATSKHMKSPLGPKIGTVNCSLPVMIALALLLLTTMLPSNAYAQPAGLVINNFRYLDAYSKTMVPAERMVIEDGKIVAIDDPNFPCLACQTIDLAGGYMVPGLIDLQQRLGTGGFARLSNRDRLSLFHKNLYWGITTVFNPSIKSDLLATLREAVHKSPKRYPRFLTANQTIGPEGGWGDVKTATVGGLKAAINAQIKAGAVVIRLSYDDKAWLAGEPLPVFSESALSAAITCTHQRERRVFVHTTQVSLAKKAILAGADGIASGLISGTVDAELISMMKSRRTVYLATLSAFAAIADNAASANRQLAFDPKRVHKSSLYKSLSSQIMAQNWRDWWRLADQVPAKLARLSANTKKLIDAGVTVGLGSDAGTPGVVFGASLLDEMQRHVEIGLKPLDAVVMATNANARILYLNNITGTIEVGKTADLVLLSADPSQSINAFKNIAYTIRGGQLYDRHDF